MMECPTPCADCGEIYELDRLVSEKRRGLRTGRLVCKQCHDEAICESCKGTGDCPDCEGAGELAGDYFAEDGMRPCERCGGKGLCPSCRGDGAF